MVDEVRHGDPNRTTGGFSSDKDDTRRKLLEECRERREVEAVLRQREEEYRSLIDNLNVGIYRNTADTSGRFLKANPAIAQIFGYDSVEAFMRVSVADLYMHPADRRNFIDEVMAKGHVRGKELLLKKRDGTPIWASCTARVATDSDGSIKWIDGIIEDITQRRCAEESLRENEAKFRSLFDLSPQAIVLVDFETAKIHEVNDRFCGLLGYDRDEILGKTAVELHLYSAKDQAAFDQHLSEGGVVQGMAIEFSTKSGPKISTQVYSQLIQITGQTFVLSILLDVTEQKRLEAQFQHAQRIEAIGTLAGGIAHDFNNLLMAIQGNVSLLRIKFGDIVALDERLKTIEQFIQNGSDLTRQLLGFARGGKYEVKPVCLNELVQKSADMFGRTKKEIKIHHDLREDLWPVEADPGQIQQVALNLYVNAWQAMPTGGELYLKTDNLNLDGDKVPSFALDTGKYVRLSVSDTGVGMDKETLERIFDPFFTTKEMGRGTGLGLASAYGIVKNHGGMIEAHSNPGRGTTFDVYLPASEKVCKGPAGVQTGGGAAQALGGNETILLVDDEAMILEIACELLEHLGYRVLVARSGVEALEQYEQNKDRIDLVLLDLIMPGMSGNQTFDGLKAINPDVKVVLSSGYSLNGEASAILLRGGQGFIQKPFDEVTLSQRIREILDHPAPAACWPAR
jgi:PAS domain S-box-containing protein